MKNRDYLAKMSDRELAVWISRTVFQHEAAPEDFCRGVCQYANAKGNCTHFDKDGNVDCLWTFEERVENWLTAQHKK